MYWSGIHRYRPDWPLDDVGKAGIYSHFEVGSLDCCRSRWWCVHPDDERLLVRGRRSSRYFRVELKILYRCSPLSTSPRPVYFWFPTSNLIHTFETFGSTTDAVTNLVYSSLGTLVRVSAPLNVGSKKRTSGEKTRQQQQQNDENRLLFGFFQTGLSMTSRREKEREMLINGCLWCLWWISKCTKLKWCKWVCVCVRLCCTFPKKLKIFLRSISVQFRSVLCEFCHCISASVAVILWPSLADRNNGFM